MPSPLLSAPCKWFLTQNIPCTVSILILISFLQELKCRKVRWCARSHTARGVEGRRVGLWLWSLCDLLGCRKPLPVSHVFPEAKGKRPDIGAFYDLTPANCLTLCPPLPGHTGESVPQGSPRSARAQPSPRTACGARLSLLSQHSQFRVPETTKIPGPLRFAGFVPTFEFLLTLLFLGHLLFGSSRIFSYHDSVFYA